MSESVRERDEGEESKRLGDTSRVGECGAAEENLLACNVGPRASKTPLHSLSRPLQSLPTYLISLVDSHALPPPRGLEALIVASDGNAAVGQ